MTDAERIEFAKRIAKTFNESSSSEVFFWLLQAYPEKDDTWEWEDFQNLLNQILEISEGKK